MERTHRMWNLFTPAAQRNIAFALVAAAAFLLGTAFAVRLPNLVPFGQPSAAVSAAKVAPAYSGSPIQSAGSSAYDGRHVARRAALSGTTPIRSASSSAYDGRSPRVARAVALQHNDTPIQTAASSAYDGQPVLPTRRAVTPGSSTPITSASSSAYQPNR